MDFSHCRVYIYTVLSNTRMTLGRDMSGRAVSGTPTGSPGPQRLVGHIILIETQHSQHLQGRSPEEVAKHVEERLASLRSIDELQEEK